MGKPSRKPSLGLTPSQMQARRKRMQRRWYKRNRAELLERFRAYYHGRHRDWWLKACRKAGIEI